MADNILKRQLVDTYLKHQAHSISQLKPSPASECSESPNIDTTLVVYNDLPENISLEEFKNYVKKWLECDNFIKRARDAIKERKKMQDKLAGIITKYMCKYNIEDLNTKEGRIRCKTLVVKTPVSQKLVKQRITDYFKNNESQRDDILHKIYEDREKVEKVSLRRLKIS